MIIKSYAERCHKAAVEKGFWMDKGSPFMKDQHLALIISELSEALEAFRKDKRANVNSFIETVGEMNRKSRFEKYIKDSFEDEMADVFIRLMDFTGGYNLSPETIQKYLEKEMKCFDGYEFLNIPQAIFFTMKSVIDIRFSPWQAQNVGEACGKIFAICRYLDINLPRHIDWKLDYNLSREFLHGKKF